MAAPHLGACLFMGNLFSSQENLMTRLRGAAGTKTSLDKSAVA
jgi:hypothetical protein